MYSSPWSLHELQQWQYYYLAVSSKLLVYRPRAFVASYSTSNSALKKLYDVRNRK